ncbi:hypothetical protein [uncultured Microbulbifer sp.]|uniref:hypothetical protein n=1 Tax=uncultured Microbulbifer sp. TaxID=348147 RepID=UPI002622EB0C|nr:hypothetical protein [uncultured Microbulbifer sp.]
MPKPLTKEQMEAFEKLSSVSKRAAFLLGIGVTAELDVEEGDFTFHAYVGDMCLPITGASRLTTIERGTTWLQEKSKETEEGNQ